MKIHQLSLFLENRPGQLIEPLRVLARAGIDIRTLNLADTQDFGILRLILADWQAGAAALRQAGYVTNVTEVVAVEVPDRPGGLSETLHALRRNDINVEYMYSAARRSGERAIIVFRVDEVTRAVAALRAAGVTVLERLDSL